MGRGGRPDGDASAVEEAPPRCWRWGGGAAASRGRRGVRLATRLVRWGRNRGGGYHLGGRRRDVRNVIRRWPGIGRRPLASGGALALADAEDPERGHDLFESDVSDAPFALFAAEPPTGAVNGSSTYVDYPAPDRDLGYEGRGLKSLLYVLAARDPDAIYLASLSRRGGGPVAGLLRHYHVAVLAPYFDEAGAFRTAVFESAAETSLEALVARGPKDFVHLVRIRAESSFDPPPFPAPLE